MDKFERIENFFDYDLEIKKLLNDLAPNLTDGYDEEYIFKYSDRLYDALKVLKYYIVRIMNSFNMSNVEYINQIFQKYENDLINSGSNFNKLIEFYKVNLSDMREEFINDINTNCFAYGMTNNLISSAKTVNEILHFLHHYIVNNEEFYNSIPEIEEKDYIFLRGKTDEIAKEIYDKILENPSIDVGITDIISLNNKILIMVRDKGHSLTLEVTKEENDYTVRYFIPKLCNYIMINNLKGVTKVKRGSNFTVGLFNSSFENIASDVVDLIDKVPGDECMRIEGGLYEFMEHKGKRL